MKIAPPPPAPPQMIPPNTSSSTPSTTVASAPQQGAKSDNPFENPQFQKLFFASLATSMVATGSFVMDMVRRNEQAAE